MGLAIHYEVEQVVSLYTENMISARIFTTVMWEPVVMHFTAGSLTEGAQKGDLPAVMNVFTTGSTYDPATKAVSVFAAVSYVKPGEKI